MIEHTLRKRKIPANVSQYILNFLKIRYSKDTGQLKAGVAQGCPLSMMIFVMCIDDTVKELCLKWPCIAYADDLLLILNEM